MTAAICHHQALVRLDLLPCPAPPPAPSSTNSPVTASNRGQNEEAGACRPPDAPTTPNRSSDGMTVLPVGDPAAVLAWMGDVVAEEAGLLPRGTATLPPSRARLAVPQGRGGWRSAEGPGGPGEELAPWKMAMPSQMGRGLTGLGEPGEHAMASVGRPYQPRS